MLDNDISTLFDLLPIGAYRSSPAGRQLRANAALVRLNGYQTEAELLAAVEDIGREWYVDAGQRTKFSELLERDGTVTDFVSEVYRHKTRERIWVRENAHVVRDRRGRVLYFEGTVEDITAQRSALAALEQSERRFRALTEKAQTLTLVCDEQGRVNYVSPASQSLLGKSAPSLCGSIVFDWIQPDDRDEARVQYAAVVERRNSGLPTVHRFHHADGQWRSFEALANNCLADAAVAGIVVNFRDVTEREAAQLALQTATERAALIARQAGIGTWESDRDGVPVSWDEQMYRLRGLAPQDGVLDRAERLALVHPDDRERVTGAHSRLDENGLPLAYEFRVRLPDGSWRWLASRSTLLRDENGQPLRRVGVNWDVTESKNAEIARQQALLAERESRTKSQFLSRMSHELRTPLNAVLGFTQLLQREAEQSAASAQLAMLGHIRAAGEHLLALVNDVLDLSSVEAGTLKAERQPVRLGAAIEQALPLVAPMAAAHRVAVHVGRAEGTVFADPNRLRQVLLNLLSNSIKYNHAGGQVWLDAAEAADRVRLRVRDNGRGLRPEQLAHLFEPFNRLGAEGAGIQGSGIGLTIAKSLVESMGGRIRASSDVTHGTTFEIDLPAHAGTAVERPAVAPADRRTDEDSTRRAPSGQLLYIEDDEINVLLVQESLRSLPGLRLTAEPTGVGGVTRAGTLAPGLILIDMHLPDIDGFEVLRRLRADPATAAIPCIALSANAMPEDIERALASGFDDYWTKPIRIKPFLDALARRFPSVAEPDPAAAPVPLAR